MTRNDTTPADGKAIYWKTAYALISCARFEAGKCVAVKYSYTQEGVDWFEINKTEDGPIDPVFYPTHHLNRFCI